MEESTVSKNASKANTKPVVTIEGASKIEDREVPFEDLISELRY